MQTGLYLCSLVHSSSDLVGPIGYATDRIVRKGSKFPTMVLSINGTIINVADKQTSTINKTSIHVNSHSKTALHLFSSI